MPSKIVNCENRFVEKHGKSFLMAVNTIYMIVYLLIFGMGIWVAFYDNTGVIAAFIMGIGLIMASLHFFGFWTAFKERTTGLKVYAWILVILEVLAIIGALTSLGNTSTVRRIDDDDDEDTLSTFMLKANVMTYVNTLIQIMCIYVAFRYATVLKKAKSEDLPPDYSKI